MDERNRERCAPDQETVIREMKEEDCEAQAYVIYSSWHDTYPGMIDPEFLKRLTLERCIASAHRNLGNCIVAQQDGKVVGTAVYGECRDEDLENAGEVYALYILKEYRHRGIGRKLIRACLELLPQKTIAVKALSANRNAIRFYQSCGFETDCRMIRVILTETEETRLLLRRE